MNKLTGLRLAFDEGHSSIGWAVFGALPDRTITLLGCGVVTFGADDCLASKRRVYRRMRRHARSTRQRITRMEKLLAHLKLLTTEQIAAKHRQPQRGKPETGGHSTPWLLAARILASNGEPKHLLDWPQLWDVLRWYAHNRGYDGNARWANQPEAVLSAAEQDEKKADTEKEQNAVKLMKDHGRKTMAETVFADLFAEFSITDPTQVNSLPFLQKRFKANQCAFPRAIVEGEVRRLLQAHKQKLPGCDDQFIDLLLARKLTEANRVFLASIGIKLPQRFEGGLLFGQLVPRFDNRIIGECPIIGGKVPGKHCHEFLEFRWAMTLANIRIGHGNETYRDRDNKETKLRVLNADERRNVDARVRRLGFLKVDPDKPGKDGHVRESRNELRQILIEETKCDRHNLDTLLLHPDAKDGLKLVPIRGDTTAFRVAWGAFDGPQHTANGRYCDDSLRHRFTTQLLRQKKLSVREVLRQLDTLGKTEVARRMRASAEAAAKGKKTKLDPAKLEELLDAEFYCDKLKGRARYSRAKLAEAVQQVFHKTKPIHPLETGGCLCFDPQEKERRDAKVHERLRIEEKIQAQVAARAESEGKTGKRWAAWRRSVREKLRKEKTDFSYPPSIAAETNNHLVRHRLTILKRLHDHLVREFADNDPTRVEAITVEVARDLQTMSGMTNKEKAKELTGKLKNHHDIAAWLAEQLKESRDENGRPFVITPNLIRKARIADDLDRKCPYTGKPFDMVDLAHRTYDKDHVIPRSKRLSDALEALVITSREINAAKKNRTALQFVKEMNLPENRAERDRLGIQTEAQFRAFVDKLKTKGHPEDSRRRKRRKELLLVEKYEEKEFTPADLTKTRHITTLALQVLEAAHQSRIKPISIPGSVTSAFRDKTWKLLPLLGAANGEVNKLLDEKQKANAEGRDFNLKDAIRSTTHLHHALDAIAVGLITSRLVPAGEGARAGLDGTLARLIHKAKLTEEEASEFRKIVAKLRLPRFYRWGMDNRLDLQELDESMLKQIRERLAEKRVVQHIPADMSGLKVEENTRGVERVKDDRVFLRQQKRDEKTGKLTINRTEEAAGKTLGLNPDGGEGSLQQIKGVRVISDNFGVAILDHAAPGEDKFAIIPHHKVWHRIQELKSRNGGRYPRILRIGTLVRVPNKSGRSDYRGVWMVRGAQINKNAGYLVDISAPDVIEYRVSGRDDCAQNVRLQSLVDGGLEIIKSSLTGIPVSQIPESQISD